MNKEQFKNVPAIVIGGLLLFGLPFILPQKKNAQNEAPAMSAEKVYQACRPELGDENCYAKQFEPLAEAKGAAYAFETLFVLQKTDPKAIGCHLIAHAIGLGTYRHDPSKWQNEIRSISPACSYGAVHGVLESYVDTLPGRKLPKELVPDICGTNPRADCNHIIGHLILVQTEANADKALDICDVFKAEPVQLEHCYTGVFMEYQTALNLISHGLAPQSWQDWPSRVPELERMCRTYDGDKAVACWKEIVHAAAARYRNDATEVFAFCDSAPMTRAASECKFHSIGIMAAASNFDYAKTRFICEAKQKHANFTSDCYMMLASSTLSTINNSETQQATRQFCASLEAAHRENCLGQLNYFEQNDH